MGPDAIRIADSSSGLPISVLGGIVLPDLATVVGDLGRVCEPEDGDDAAGAERAWIGGHELAERDVDRQCPLRVSSQDDLLAVAVGILVLDHLYDLVDAVVDAGHIVLAV